jgi:hypothetical protein
MRSLPVSSVICTVCGGAVPMAKLIRYSVWRAWPFPGTAEALAAMMSR